MSHRKFAVFSKTLIQKGYLIEMDIDIRSYKSLFIIVRPVVLWKFVLTY